MAELSEQGESTFKSIPDVASSLLPIIPKSAIRTKFDSINKIGRVSAPKLIIHGERDTLIPFSQGKELYEKAGEPKEFYPIPQADHNDTYLVAGEEYFRRWAAFVRSVEDESSSSRT